MILLELVRNYQTLLNRKAELDAETKENNAAIEETKNQIAQQMVDDDCPKISTGGYTFFLQNKTAYSKRPDEELAKSGADYFDVLRKAGLGDIITEAVNPKTLQAAVRAYVEEHGELSEGLATVIKSYEYIDVARRKDQRRK